MQNSDVSFFLRKRYLICLLAWLGMIFMFILRTNLSLAIVEMTSDKNITLKNESVTKKADFNWDSRTKGFILSIFPIGFLCGPMGGVLALKFGGVNIFGIGIAMTGLLTFLTPFFLRTHFWIFIVARMLEGIFESFSMASTSDVFVRWAPPNERCRLLLCSFAGALVGVVVNYPLCGFIAYKYGWEYVFYITGGMSIVWYIFWFLIAVNDPTTDTLMSQKERDYFKTFVSDDLKKVQDQLILVYPWKSIFTCRQFWIYLNELFSYYWSNSFLLYCLPLYVNDAFDVSIQDIGFLSGLPNFCGLVGLLISAFLSDYMRSGGRFTKSFVHKFFIGTGQLTTALCFIIVALWANFEQSIICFTLARLLMEFSEMSYHVLVIDLFYKYAGLIKGFGLTVVGIAYFLNPIIMGFIVSDHSKSSWNIYFLFVSVFNIWSIIIFYMFGSAETLEWAVTKSDDKIGETNILSSCT